MPYSEPSAACPRCGVEFAGLRCPRCAFSEALNGSVPSSAAGGPAAGPAFWTPPPREFQQYRLETNDAGELVELGRGGMGVTYRAFDTRLELPVALKFINPLVFGGRAIEARFLREARAAARLRHQNVASVLNLGQEEGRWFYAMELVQGRTLEQVVRDEGPLLAADVREIGRQVALALAEAEQLQLVHRDIKPANLMVERTLAGALPGSAAKWRVKVIDFGLVKSLDAAEDASLTDAGLLGTPHFASPEQLREETVDLRSDFYSLGATLCYALTGKTLASGSRAEVMAQHLKPEGGHVLAQFAHLEGRPEDPGWLRPLLAPAKADRPVNAAALLESLYGPATTLARLQTAPPRHRTWLRVSAYATAAALAVGGYFTLTKSQRDPEKARDLVAQALSRQTLLTLAENNESIRLLERAVQLDPASASAWVALSRANIQNQVRFSQGREWVGKAAQAIAKAKALAPASPEVRRGEANLLYGQGRVREAREILRGVDAETPNDPRVLRALAAYNRELGNLTEALSMARRATELAPKEATSWSMLANVQKKMELDPESEANYKKAIELGRSTPENYLGLAHVLFLKGDFAGAMAATEQVGEAMKFDPGLLCLRGQIQIQLGDFPAAVASLEAAVKENADGNPLYFGQVRYKSLLGWLLLQSKDTSVVQRGRALLEDAIRLDQAELAAGNEGHDYCYSLAASYAALGREQEALTQLRLARSRGWKDRRTLLRDRRFDEMRSSLRTIS